MIEVNQLHKSFGQQQVLHGVDLQIDEGGQLGAPAFFGDDFFCQSSQVTALADGALAALPGLLRCEAEQQLATGQGVELNDCSNKMI